MLIIFSAFITAISLLNLGPTFSLLQVWIKEESILVLILHCITVGLFIYRRNKRALAIIANHIFWILLLLKPLIAYLPTEQKISLQPKQVNELYEVTFGEPCTPALAPQHQQHMLLSSSHGKQISLRGPQLSKLPFTLLSSLNIPSVRLQSTTSSITIDVIQLSPPTDELSEYRGRIGMRRLIGTLREHPERRIVIGGIGSSLYSERVKLLSKAAELHEIGWKKGVFMNSLHLFSPRRETIGYDGIWLSQDLDGQIQAIKKCEDGSTTITFTLSSKNTHPTVQNK